MDTGFTDAQDYQLNHDSVRNKILVVGPANAGKEALLSQIIGNDAPRVPCEISERITAFPWTIDTKYYTVNVEFWILDSTEDIHTNADLQSNLGEHVEALILVFDAKHRPSFDAHITKWSNFIEEYGPSVLLCVANKIENNESSNGTSVTSAKLAKYHMEYNEWCVENGTELVTLHELESEIQDEESEIFKEKFGADRVVEALQTNMWPGMTYKTSLKPATEEQAASLYSENEYSDLIRNTVSQLTKAEKEYVHNSETNGEKVATDTDKPAEKKKNENVPSTPTTTAPSSSQVNNVTKKNDDLGTFRLGNDDLIFKDLVGLEKDLEGEELDEMADLEAFEKTLSQLSILRSKAFSLPDKERRELAAKVALSFLGGFEDESDDD